MILIVMGVAGSGKSTVGELLAQKLGCDFLEGDDFHPPSNRDKMARGQALTDEDRKPWLDTLERLVAGKLALGQDAVLACSALKQAYRDLLSGGRPGVKFIYLKADQNLIRTRLEARKSRHFPPTLMESQFEALEEPVGAWVADASVPPEALVDEIMTRMRR